jgi:hypothetical protein
MGNGFIPGVIVGAVGVVLIHKYGKSLGKGKS